MSWKIQRVAWWALILVAALTSLSHHVRAARDLSKTEIAELVVCDTADQVRAYVAAVEAGDDDDEAIVKASAGEKDACLGPAWMSVIQESQDGELINTRVGLVGVFVVNIVAVQGPQGNWITVDPAAVQYTPVIVTKGQGI